ncbi:cAMP-regulated phosphoprotein 21 isoform X2 [Syngnathus typhle]|uniref:cAMP-regulated phosphoprotein 21 isoform X2 n=1 Tax=Syngnathus typhle TaxID=161592 RepID=UPI002A6A3924|nr:cAMP-regulated phosphoprotein 21 isoform X2 [Syngnathus typhle]
MDTAVEADPARNIGSRPASPLPCDSVPTQEIDKDSKQSLCHQTAVQKKVKPKGKLVRSMAVCDDKEEHLQAPTSESVSCPEEEVEKSCSPDKESSVEYRDSTGVDLQRFIVDTLNSNPRDRMMMLKLEQDMVTFIMGDSTFKKFPHMSSYHRMLVHRVAAFFGMEHNVDQTGKSVIINRTSSTRIPEQRFLDQVQEDKATEIPHWKTILKRDSSSDEQTRRYTLRDKQSKSMEEREEEYQKVRERIFSQEPLCTREGGHVESRPSEECNAYAETQRRRQLFRGSRDSSGSSWTGSSRQSSTETDCRYGNEPQPWSSTDSDSSSYQWTAAAAPKPRPPQAANSGWEPHGTAGSVSLYRVSSEPPTMAEPPAHPAFILENGIPPGSILVNPHTGQPFLNPDGSPVVYNPPGAQQPIRSQMQGAPAQQPPQQVYSSVSYSAPQMLPVAPSQQYPAVRMEAPFPVRAPTSCSRLHRSSQVEDLSQQFAHVAVSCQPASEPAPLYPPAQGFVFAAPPPPPPPPAPQAPNAHSYCQPSPQGPAFYYSQYPTSAQHPVKAASPGCSAGYGPVVGVPQQQSYTALPPHHCSILQGGVSVYQPGKLGEAGYCCMVAPAHPHCGPAWTTQH